VTTDSVNQGFGRGADRQHRLTAGRDLGPAGVIDCVVHESCLLGCRRQCVLFGCLLGAFGWCVCVGEGGTECGHTSVCSHGLWSHGQQHPPTIRQPHSASKPPAHHLLLALHFQRHLCLAPHLPVPERRLVAGSVVLEHPDRRVCALSACGLVGVVTSFVWGLLPLIVERCSELVGGSKRRAEPPPRLYLIPSPHHQPHKPQYLYPSTSLTCPTTSRARTYLALAHAQRLVDYQHHLALLLRPV